MPHTQSQNRSVSPLAVLCLLGALAAPSFLSAQPTLEDSPIRLSSNENAYGFTPKAKEAMMKYIKNGGYYNRNNVSELVAALAKKENVTPEHVITTAGSGPVLMMTALAYAEPGKNVVTTAMGYTQLTRKFEASGGEIKYAPLSEEMGYDFDALKAAIDDDTVIVYICNPNNPTGSLADPNELKKFIMSVPSDILVFVDEAYLELSEGSFAINTMSPMVKIRKNMLLARTFSKSYGMAGFRVGYGVGDPAVIEKIRHYYMGPPTYLTAIAAVEAIKDTEHMAKNAKRYQAVRKYTSEAFDQMGIEYVPSQGAFIYFKSGMDVDKLREALADSGILISGSRESGVEPGTYSKWARVSMGKKSEMDAFLTTLAGLLGKEFSPSENLSI
ncbi:MAG: histidinol-phosphate transaminase [Verrucomicrobiota bacterium]